MKVDLTTDRALLDGFRRGDRGALERVYRAHVQDVVRVFRLGFVSGEARVPGIRDVDRCMELAQSVFVRAFSEPGRKGYDGVRPYGPYLARIAKNLRIDALRKEGREIPLVSAVGEDGPDLEDRLLPPEPAEPEVELHRQRLAEVTQAFLADQDEELRTFVRLRFEQDASQYEVLEAMGITRRRVRTLEKRALEGLRAFLAARGLP